MDKCDAIISARGVAYSYVSAEGRPNTAIDGIDIDIARGEFLCVIGHNGSGKSTFAKLLNALLIPTEGNITVKGMNTRDEDKTWEIRKACGMVFQNPDNQLVASLVEDDIAFGPENIGVKREEIRQRVDFAAAAVGMSAFLNKAPNMLSGGQKQRVALAGVLALMPDIIVLDEPTAMLDPAGRQEVMQTIIKLNRELSKTIILVTHYMEEAVGAGRIVVMEEGRITMQGTPREIFSKERELCAAHLTPPIPTQAWSSLKNDFDMGDCPVTREELLDELCRLLQNS